MNKPINAPAQSSEQNKKHLMIADIIAYPLIGTAFRVLHGKEECLEQELTKCHQELNRYKVASDLAVRCNIVLRFFEDHYDVKTICKQCGVCRPTVQKWIFRFNRDGFKGLNDAPRSGRPCENTQALKSFLDTLLLFEPDYLVQNGFFEPYKKQLENRRLWTIELLSRITGFSQLTVSKYLKQYGIDLRAEKRSYCFSLDPQFLPKSLLVDLLYRFQDNHGYEVHCFDECPCWQVTHVDYGVDSGGQVQKSDRREREGVVHLLAFLIPKSGQVTGYVADKKGTDELCKVFKQYFSQPDKQCKKHIVIMDNLAAHGKLQEYVEQHIPNVQFAFIPTNASWMNLVECVFSLIKRQVSPNSSDNTAEELEQKLKTAINQINDLHTQFRWTGEVIRKYNQLLDNARNIRNICDIDLKAIGESYERSLTDSVRGATALQTTIAYSEGFSDDRLDSFNELIDSEAVKDYIKPSATNNHADDLATMHALPEKVRDALSLGEEDHSRRFFRKDVLEAYEDPEKATNLIESLLKVVPHKPYRAPKSGLVKKTQIVKAERDLRRLKQQLQVALNAKNEQFVMKCEKQIQRKIAYLDRVKALYQQQFSEAPRKIEEILKGLLHRLADSMRLFFDSSILSKILPKTECSNVTELVFKVSAC